MNMVDRERILRKTAEVEQRLTSLREQLEVTESVLKTLQQRLRQDEDQVTRRASSDSALAKPTSASLKPEDKAALFLRLFRGRDDVYPKLWQNPKTGKRGYAPACANEWIRGVCEKPRVKCGECLNQAFLPTSVDTVLDHLQGRDVIGPDRYCLSDIRKGPCK